MAANNRGALDQIHIRDLHLRCVIGINEWERDKKQDVLVQITLFADLSKAARTDNIADTVDYKMLTKKVIDIIEESSFLLVERLAQAVLDTCFEDEKVQGARAVVEKPGALRFARSVGVELERWR